MNGEIKAWHLQGFIALIKEELNFFENFKINHIRREGNQIANMKLDWKISKRSQHWMMPQCNEWISNGGRVTLGW